MRSFNRRHWVLVATIAASAAALANCGDDDTSTTATGTAGSGGSGGASGSGGTGGGKAGSGGTAGTTTGTPDGGGGTAGKGGAAGSSGSGGTAGKAGGGGTAGKGGTGGTAGSPTDGGADGDASPATANVRVAHLSPGAPAVDFCLAVHGTTNFTGPVLVANSVPTGLAYATVTKYLPVPAAQYDVRIVAPGATSCATPLAGLPDVTNLPALPAGGSVTLAAEGEVAPGDAGGQPFGLKAYVDDTTVATGKAKLRFVHASSGTPSVDVGLGGGVLFTPVFSDVAFGNTATATNGYVETAPLTNAELSARAHGTTSDALAIKGATLAAGNIATAFAIGKIGNVATPLKVLLCVDNAAPVGALTSCVSVGDTPQRAHVRVAHLSPDAPAVDVCLTPTGTPFSGTPVLKSLGSTAGLAYSQVTTYVDLPVTAYDVRIVAANSADCVNKVANDTANVAVTDALYATIGALGVFMPPDGGAADAGMDPVFGLKVFVDNHAPSATSTNILFRFIHASPGTPTVDVGTGSGGGFAKVFGAVTYSNIAVGTGIDAKGYVDTAAFSNTTLSARATGTTADALVVPSVTIAAGNYATAFAIGNKTGDTTKPLKALLCVDSAPAVGLLTSCTVAP